MTGHRSPESPACNKQACRAGPQGVATASRELSSGGAARHPSHRLRILLGHHGSAGPFPARPTCLLCSPRSWLRQGAALIACPKCEAQPALAFELQAAALFVGTYITGA